MQNGAHLVMLSIIPLALGGCSNYSFKIQASTVVPGAVLEIEHSNSLDDCVRRCGERDECTAANFVLSTAGEPHCVLVNAGEAVSVTKMPVKEQGIYAATRFCVTPAFASNCADRRWTFEKFGQRQIIDSRFIVAQSERGDLVGCLENCALRENCQAVTWTHATKRCQLLSISLQAVHNPRQYFRYDASVDLYESNCVQGQSTPPSCSFLTLKNAGITDHFDEKLEMVASPTACEEKCLQRSESAGLCRLYTFDSTTSTCFLCHSSSRGMGRSPLDNGQQPGLTTGELDDCIEFSLKCKPESLELSAASLKLFAGELKTKKSRTVMCTESIQPDYAFNLDIPYKKCGIELEEMPQPSFSGTLFLKEGSTQLVTIRDKVIQVHCRLHSQGEVIPDQVVTVNMQVSAGNGTRLRNGLIVPAGPLRLAQTARKLSKYSLMLQKDGHEPKTVQKADDGEIVIQLGENDDDASDFTVRNLVAQQTGKEPIVMIDNEGCVKNNEIVRSISRNSSNRLAIKIAFDKFEETDIVYHALVEPCSFKCMPECNKPYISEYTSAKATRKRRAISSGRKYELAQDVYRISGGRIKVLGSNGTTSDVLITREKMEGATMLSALSNCICNDLECMLTLLCSCIQLLMLFACVFVFSCYMRQWNSYRVMTARPAPLHAK